MKKKKKMIIFDERLSPEAEQLDRYLSRYSMCIRVKKSLERRSEAIKQEFAPLKSPKLDGMPHGGATGETPITALLYRLDEINDKINKQMSKASKILTEIISVIDMMPDITSRDSLSKLILENKYIDRMDTDRICRENHYSKSTVTRYWKQGLYTLLEFKKVQKILKEYTSAECEAEENEELLRHSL